MSFKPIKVLDIELSRPIPEIQGLQGYKELKVLIRLHGQPLGYVRLPCEDDCCSAAALGRAIVEQHTWSIIRHLVTDGITATARSQQLHIEELVDIPHPAFEGRFPLVTVAVCTRDRTDDLAICLDAVGQLDYPALDLLVVDNAPRTDTTERLLRERYPNVRYVCEPRPGLDWARNRAIVEAHGEIIAYTDDDVIVDPGWVRALAQNFVEHPDVMAVTGLVVPYELETEAQALFEAYGGFGRGFERKWYRLDAMREKSDLGYIGAGMFGTGANMAYRRSLFDSIGLFDPALDVGTVTNGGGDLEMFFRVLVTEHTLAYEPAALVRHRHRRDYDRLHTQIANNGIGFYSYLVRSALAYGDHRLKIVRLGIWWFWWWNVRRLLKSYLHTRRFPRDLILAELRGSVIGLSRYQKARRAAAEIARAYGPVTRVSPELLPPSADSSQLILAVKPGAGLSQEFIAQ
jgi:O-antigen biosynthesis protein